MKRSSFIALGATLALAIAAPSARAADEEEVRKLTQDAEKIGKLMESVRGLKFNAPVKKGIQSRDELRSFILEEIEKEMTDDKVAAQQKSYEKMGFLKPGLNLKKTIVDLYAEQIAAFYNPERKELFLIEHGGPEQNMVMAHELTHALQDQNFDLLPLQKGIVDNDDRSLALTSVIEGDATVAMIAYTMREQGLPLDVKMLPDIGGLMRMQAQLGESMGGAAGKMMKEAPKVLTQNMLFGYVDGASFCQKLIKKKGGYQAVSEAFGDLPTSSEQILHPEKYFGKERDLPIAVKMPDVAEGLGKEWKPLLKNVMGEFNTSLLFQEKLPKADADKAAAGWGGDAWQTLEGPDGGVLFVWWSTWDTEDDAQEFADTYKAFAQKRGDGARLDIERRGTQVAIVDGAPSDATLEKVGALLDKVETETGYPAIDKEAVLAGLGSPLADLKKPDEWKDLTSAAAGEEGKKPLLRWKTDGGVEVTALEGAAAHKSGIEAAKEAARLVKPLSRGDVKVEERRWAGLPAGCVSYTAKSGERAMSYYIVRGDKEWVVSAQGNPEALHRAFLSLREANPKLFAAEGAHEGEKREQPKKKEPTLF